MAKNYYITLGISRGANLNQIKKAYRTIAKQSHPDISQSEDARQFREVREAYETLSDTNRRKVYDAALERDHPPVHLSPRRRHRQERPHLFNEMSRFESFIDDFFEGFVPGIYEKPRFRAPQKDLYYEVILTPGEALHGGLFPIRIPVIERCPRCSHADTWHGYDCHECDGYGYVQSEREFSLSIPPRTPDHTEVTLSLEDIGLADVNLFIKVRIDPYPE